MLVPVFAARWRSIRKYINSSDNDQTKTRLQKQMYHKESSTLLYPKNDSKTGSRRIRAKLQYFPTQVKEMHIHEMITTAHPTAAQRPFPFL
jgi:hypothetical protein